MKRGVAKATNLLGLILIAGGSLSACGKSEDEPLVVNPGRELTPADGEFGEKFEKALNADPNSEPRFVEDRDVPPVSYTDEPVVLD